MKQETNPSTNQGHEANTMLCTVPFRTDTPKTKEHKLTVPVYFMADEQLWRGEFHVNGCFYAYGCVGNIECLASMNGKLTGAFSGDGNCSKCVGWCYIDELRHCA